MALSLPDLVQRVVFDSSSAGLAQRRIHAALAGVETDMGDVESASDSASGALRRHAVEHRRTGDEADRHRSKVRLLVHEFGAAKRPVSDFDLAMRQLHKSFVGAAGGLSGFIGHTVKLLKIPSIVAGVGLLAQAIGAVGTAAVGVIGSLSPLVATFAALPGLIGAGISGIGTVILGFRGVGDAIKAQAKAEEGAAKTAKAHDTALRGVRDAERAVEGTQRTAKGAQDALNDARRQAVEDLEDLRRAATGAALSERGAVLALERARARLRQVRLDPFQSNLDRQDAILDVEQAELSLADAQDHRQDTTTELADAERKGVEGSDRVVAAQEAIRDAADASASAQERLADAVKTLRDEMAGGDGAAADFKAAMDKLSPAGQEFVRTIVDAKGDLEALSKIAQTELLPSFTHAVNVLRGPMKDALTDLISTSGRAVGGVVDEIVSRLNTTQFKSDLATLTQGTDRTITNLGRALGSMIPTLTGIAVAAQPLVDHFTTLAVRAGSFLEHQVAMGRDSGRLDDFFSRLIERVDQFGHIIGNLTGGLYNFFRSAVPFGDTLLDRMDRSLAKFREWTGSAKGRNAIAEYFRNTQAPMDAMLGLLGDVSRLFVRVTQSSTSGFVEFVSILRARVIPAIETLFNGLDGNFLPQLATLIAAATDVFVQFAGTSGPLTTFIRLVSDLLETVHALVEQLPFLKPVFFALTTGLAAVKAFKFVGAISGLTTIIGLFGKATAAVKTYAAAQTLASGTNLAATFAKSAGGAAAATAIGTATVAAGMKGGAAAKIIGREVAPVAAGGATSGVLGLAAAHPILTAAVVVGGAALYQWNKKAKEAKQRADEYAVAVRSQARGTENATRAFIDQRLVSKGVIDDAEKLGFSIDDVRRAVEGDDDAMRRLMAGRDSWDDVRFVAKIQKEADAFAKAKDQVNEEQRGMRLLAAAHDAALTPMDRLVRSSAELAAARDKANKAAAESLSLMAAAQSSDIGLRRSRLNLTGAQSRYEETLKREGATAEEIEAARLDLEDATLAVAEAAVRAEADQRKANDRAEQSTIESVGTQIGELDRLRAAYVAKFGPSSEIVRVIDAQIAKLKEWSAQATIELNFSIAPAAVAKLQDMANVFAAAQGPFTGLLFAPIATGLTNLVNSLLPLVTTSIGNGVRVAAAGAILPATVGSGFMTNGPRAIVGEGNPAHPEFVIPTDPAHRRNARSLTARLLSMVGLAAGGTVVSSRIFRPDDPEAAQVLAPPGVDFIKASNRATHFADLLGESPPLSQMQVAVTRALEEALAPFGGFRPSEISEFTPSTDLAALIGQLAQTQAGGRDYQPVEVTRIVNLTVNAVPEKSNTQLGRDIAWTLKGVR